MPRQALAQHFLADRGVLRRIIEAADLSPGDAVVEVGPGRGVLTRELARRAGHVTAVEIDPILAAALPSILGNPSNLTVVHADARTADLGVLPPGYKVVANLPYYAANPLVRRFLEAPVKPRLMVVTVQKEVAQAMAAPPGRMTLLSVAVQLYGAPSVVCVAPPGAFRPPPKVESAVVRIDVFPSPKLGPDQAPRFFKLAQAGFAAPRKQLRNSLALGLSTPPGEAGGLLDRAGIEPSRRPGTLSVDEWLKLYLVYCDGGPGARGGLR